MELYRFFIREKLDMRELAFAKMIDRGQEDVRAGRVISNDEMAGRIRSWQK